MRQVGAAVAELRQGGEQAARVGMRRLGQGRAGSEKLRSTERPGSWDLAVRGKRRRTYRLQASLATLEHAFVPCAVEWRGVPLPAPAWQWDDATQVVRVEFTGTRGHLSIRACR